MKGLLRRYVGWDIRYREDRGEREGGVEEEGGRDGDREE